MNWLFSEIWSPYLVGVGIGVLVWLSFLLSNKAIGCSTAYLRTAGMLESLLRDKKVKKREYFQEYAPKIDWEWMLVLGIIIGSFLSAILSGQFEIEIIPGVWADAFGNVILIRLATAVLGGIFVGFGARLAGGCTSGHGISGSLQLSVSGWLALTFFFIGGIMTAVPIFHFLGG